METFALPFALDKVTVTTGDRIVFEEPAFVPGEDRIWRTDAARYPGTVVRLLTVTAKIGAFDVYTPAPAALRAIKARTVDVTTGTVDVLELSPLPFGFNDLLGKLPGGWPTFYLLVVGVGKFEATSGAVAAGARLGSAATLQLGVVFQDRVCFAPSGWIARLAEGAPAWSALAALVAPELSLLDHVGRPLVDPVSHIDAGGRLTVTRVAGMALAQPVLAEYPVTAATAAVAATADGSAPAALLLSPSGSGHVQVLDLARWFSPRPAGSALPRYSLDSRLEPLIDGRAAFKRMRDDLIASAYPGHGAFFAGLSFEDFLMSDAALPDGSPFSLSGTIKFLSLHRASLRLLGMLAVDLVDPSLTTELAAAIGFLGIGAIDTMLAIRLLGGSSPELTFGVFAVSILLLALWAKYGASLGDKLLASLEGSKATFETLDPGKTFAFLQHHPATFDDNPVFDGALKILRSVLTGLGSWHQKIQLFWQSTPAGDRLSAFVGGIDLMPSRLTDPDHRELGGYHDVHARLTGRAAYDVGNVYAQRYQLAASDALPYTTARAVGEGTHAIQIARTCFLGKDGHAFAFAPAGERTIHDTLVNAIASAREYIYIEDQYFVPDDGGPGAYLDALVAAAGHCQRLLVVMPASNDEPFGTRRRSAVLDRLRAAWGARARLGCLYRAPVLPPATQSSGLGRCTLMSPLAVGDTAIVLGPRARVPEQAAGTPKLTAFWLWIDGEVMIAHGPAVEEATDAVQLNVIRQGAAAGLHWGGKPRAHEAGTPVTLSQMSSIYVHAKTMLVDDVFVGIGSANTNRRGFFHDGEITAFTIPTGLKGSPKDNPVTALRTALWAEHLGLPPTMGAAILRDPILAWEHFRRSPLQGNRFVSEDAYRDAADASIDPFAEPLLTVLSGVLGSARAALSGAVWNDVTDPTSFLDTVRLPGPGLKP